MTRVVLPTTDLALELPDRIARSPLDEVEAAAQSFTFGGLGADPIAVRVVVSPVPIAPDQVTNALAVMRDLLQSGTPEGAERLGDAQTIIVAGHPGVVVAYRGEDVTIHSWVIILDGRQIALLVYLSSELPRSWRGVENRIAESLAGR